MLGSVFRTADGSGQITDGISAISQRVALNLSYSAALSVSKVTSVM